MTDAPRSVCPGRVDAAAMRELDAMIVEQERAVKGRLQLAETEVLPAFKGILPGTKRRVNMPEDRRHGERHRGIAAIEQRRLEALLALRAALSSPGAGAQAGHAKTAECARRTTEVEQHHVAQHSLDVLVEDNATLRDELANVLRDWNALVAAIGAPTLGGAVGHAVALRARADAGALDAVRWHLVAPLFYAAVTTEPLGAPGLLVNGRGLSEVDADPSELDAIRRLTTAFDRLVVLDGDNEVLMMPTVAQIVDAAGALPPSTPEPT